MLRHDEFFDGRPAHADGTKDLAWFGADGEEMTPERWFDHDLRVLGMYLSGKPAADGSAPDPRCWCCSTPAPTAVEVCLPGKPWGTAYDVLLDTADERPGPGGTHESGADVTLGGRTVVVLAAHR